MTPNLAAFVRAILTSDLNGCLSCACDLQDLAIKHGIQHHVRFDPAIHADPDGCAQAGDLWVDFTPGFKVLSSVQTPPPQVIVEGSL